MDRRWTVRWGQEGWGRALWGREEWDQAEWDQAEWDQAEWDQAGWAGAAIALIAAVRAVRNAAVGREPMAPGCPTDCWAMCWAWWRRIPTAVVRRRGGTISRSIT